MAAALMLAIGGCGEGPAPPTPEERSPGVPVDPARATATPVAPQRNAPLSEVLAPKLAQATLPVVIAPFPEDAARTADQREYLEYARALVHDYQQEQTRVDPYDEVQSGDIELSRALLTIALASDTEDGARGTAIELLAHSEKRAAAHTHVYLLEHSAVPWVRRRAAWGFRKFVQSDDVEGALLALLLRAKYETDAEARVWLAGSLVDFNNYSGIAELRRLASDPHAGAAAATETARIEEQLGLSLAALEAGWDAGRLPASTYGPGAALEGELWRAISELGGEHFQLRGVDDARYALSRLGREVVPQLLLALQDTDPFVRLHVAQVLERMGPRALQRAGAALIQRLDDPHDGVAAAVAEALGAVAAGAGADPLGEAARLALTTRTARGVTHELRVAAVRGLGRLVDATALPTLEGFADDTGEPDDVRMAAAEGVLALADGDGLLAYLAAQLDDPLRDAGGAEALLGRWLERAAPRSPAHAAAASLWRALAPPFERVHTPEEVKARRRARGALVAPFAAR
jgi:hypothetical protein